MDLLRLTNKLSQTEFIAETSILRKSLRQTPSLIKVLLKLALKRERYCFQFFKYFVLFPGSSQMSETQSIDTYDKLIFGDDAIHSMVKIHESKELQNKIWAFINIKALKYLKNCKTFTRKVERIYVQKLQQPVKSNAFKMIKQYNVKLNSPKQRQNPKSKYIDQQTNTSHRQKLGTKLNLYEVKIQGKNYFSSNIMIHSSFNGQEKSLNQSNKLKNVQDPKLSESRHINNELNPTQTQQYIPSKISLKSLSAQQNKLQSFHQNTQINSQTKIRFTYTSPSKQQISCLLSQNDKKTLIKQHQPEKRRQKDQHTTKYKYTLPKMFENKKICCQNFCGIGCGENCSYDCKDRGSK